MSYNNAALATICLDCSWGGYVEPPYTTGGNVNTVVQCHSSAGSQPGTYSFSVGAASFVVTIDGGGNITGVATGGTCSPGTGYFPQFTGSSNLVNLANGSTNYAQVDYSGWNITAGHINDGSCGITGVTGGTANIQQDAVVSHSNGCLAFGSSVSCLTQLGSVGTNACGSRVCGICSLYGYNWLGFSAPSQPPSSDASRVVTWYPPSAADPNIPDAPDQQVPVTITNGSGGNSPVQVCFQVANGQTQCSTQAPSTTVTYQVNAPAGGGTITPTSCNSLGQCITGTPISWDPGQTPPVTTIYVPPFPTQPNPTPTPSPNPTNGGGNEGNFQGCIAVPCVIPYIYDFSSINNTK